MDLINRCKTWTHLHNYKSNIRNSKLKELQINKNSNAGNLNPTRKIDENIASKIIKILKNPNAPSLAQLSRDLKISIHIIQDINRCRTWKYLHNYQNNIKLESELKRKG